MAEIARGFLAKLFSGVVAKRLTKVETISRESNQHEFQGTKPFRDLFGSDDRRQIRATFIYLEGEAQSFAAEGFVSWSNVRKGKPRAPEYHLYYSTNPVVEAMKPNDMAFIALRHNNSALVVVAPQESSMVSQLFWLFGINENQQLELDVEKENKRGDKISDAIGISYRPNSIGEADFVARFILDELGIEFELPETDYLDSLLVQFPEKLPSTRLFSELARSSLREKVSSVEDPDHTIMQWLDHEEKLFRRHEYFVISRKLDTRFFEEGVSNVDASLKFYKSIFNGRNSRMGQSLEHHLSAIFSDNKITFSRGEITEFKNKPDFVFPNIEAYRDPNFNSANLTMLAAKSTCKDRWRQALSEASRILPKHLVTLEAGISENQTIEMSAKNLQLIVPRSIQKTYTIKQQTWLMSLQQFLKLVGKKQYANRPSIF